MNILNNSCLSLHNSKLAIDDIAGFYIPPVITCPSCDQCSRECYFKKIMARYPSTSSKAYNNLELTKSDMFVDIVSANIIATQPKYLRIHVGGDFYSCGYLDKWITIARKFPEVKFYCYTKEVSLFGMLKKRIPFNFVYCFSYGGKEDAKIDPNTDKHCHIFSSLEEMKRAGYVSADESDLVLFDYNRIGLVYRGSNDGAYNTYEQWSRRC